MHQRGKEKFGLSLRGGVIHRRLLGGSVTARATELIDPFYSVPEPAKKKSHQDLFCGNSVLGCFLCALFLNPKTESPPPPLLLKAKNLFALASEPSTRGAFLPAVCLCKNANSYFNPAVFKLWLVGQVQSTRTVSFCHYCAAPGMNVPPDSSLWEHCSSEWNGKAYHSRAQQPVLHHVITEPHARKLLPIEPDRSVP